MDDNNSEGFGEVVTRETEESTEEPTESVQVEESTEDQEATKTEETQPSQDTETQTEEQPKLTEKGTKLDPNPQSAVHQELANEKRARLERDKVLGNPELLSKFMETQYGIKTPAKEETPAQEVQAKKYTAEDFQNIDDVAKTVNKIQSGFDEQAKTSAEEIKQLKAAVSELLFNGQASKIATTMEKDITGLRSEPELNPKSPEYIEGLEEEIASMYHQLDFDEQSGSYKGQQSIADLGKRIISTARKARQKGSLQAQTVVKDKSEGRVRTSQKASESTDTSKMSAGDSIAAGIAKTFGRGN